MGGQFFEAILKAAADFEKIIETMNKDMTEEQIEAILKAGADFEKIIIEADMNKDMTQEEFEARLKEAEADFKKIPVIEAMIKNMSAFFEEASNVEGKQEPAKEE